MLIAAFLLLGQTKGRKPLGLSSPRFLQKNETGLVDALETFVTEVESKLEALQTSVDGINREVDWMKDNATALQTSVDGINEKVEGIKDDAKDNNECCDKNDDAKCEKYRGTMNTGRDGGTCKLWKDTTYKHTDYPDAGLEENYCRNPGGYEGEKLPWCYLKKGSWHYCDVPMC